MVCQGYRPPPGYTPTMANPLLDMKYGTGDSNTSLLELKGYCSSSTDPGTLTGVNRTIVPFLACGDLSGYDSDMTYPVKVSR